MRLVSITGKLVYKNVDRFRIDWDKKSRSKIQFRVKQFLKCYWQNMLCYEEFPVYGARLKIDFFNATKKIAIEVDGGQHDEFNKFFHNNSRLDYFYSIRRDYRKEEWTTANKITLMRIKEDEVNLLSLGFFLKKFGVSIV